ncbi:hypothetical protein BXZ70DRAFT_694420 [Cristinia sonorae]|uniref:Uncharacterized protein n=1 Tax=Cristinia sonorae TaxID=1940300 RepID=A0A8K0UFM0_9AGAR|nr:hypothetical protein BXZ70DRAFT_694420 [Cristinia sonorae]
MLLAICGTISKVLHSPLWSVAPGISTKLEELPAMHYWIREFRLKCRKSSPESHELLFHLWTSPVYMPLMLNLKNLHTFVAVGPKLWTGATTNTFLSKTHTTLFRTLSKLHTLRELVFKDWSVDLLILRPFLICPPQLYSITFVDGFALDTPNTVQFSIPTSVPSPFLNNLTFVHEVPKLQHILPPDSLQSLHSLRLFYLALWGTTDAISFLLKNSSKSLRSFVFETKPAPQYPQWRTQQAINTLFDSWDMSQMVALRSLQVNVTATNKMTVAILERARTLPIEELTLNVKLRNERRDFRRHDLADVDDVFRGTGFQSLRFIRMVCVEAPGLTQAWEKMQELLPYLSARMRGIIRVDIIDYPH